MTARRRGVLVSLHERRMMNGQPPVAPELWQQIPPPVQSALLEAWEQAERRRQSLEAQVLDLKARLDPKAVLPEFNPPSLAAPLVEAGPVTPAQEAKLARGRRRRHHRTPEEKL